MTCFVDLRQRFRRDSFLAGVGAGPTGKVTGVDMTARQRAGQVWQETI